MHAYPLEINDHIEKLLNQINSEFEPEIISIIPESYAKNINCFINVEEKVKRDGGKIHYGWAILQSEILCEAERHAVWETEDDELIDITPREINVDKLMFVSDNNLIYTGQLIDNIRVNTTNNKLVDDFIALCETFEKFYTYGKRLNDDEVIVPEPALTFIRQYENLKMVFQAYITLGNTPESPCFCQDGKKYKVCHGKGIKAHFISDLLAVSRVLKERPLKA